ncbi:hypothetical protein POUND7_002102 [Theobroma cacao]
MEQPEPQVPHVVFFPFPAHGHIKPMFRLAELLSHANFQVTFLNTQRNHDLLLLSSDIPAFRSRYPNFQLLSYPDKVPLGLDPHRRSEQGFVDLLLSTKAAAKPALSELLEKKTGRRPPTCIIADWAIMCSSAMDVAKEFGNIPVFAFQTACAHYMWMDFHLLKLIEEGEVPLRDKDMDKPVTSISGLGMSVRRRDLSGFARFDTVCKQVIEISTNYGSSAVSQAYGVILNTFDKLEAPVISKLSSFLPFKIYTIGPLHCLLNNYCIKDSNPLHSINVTICKEDTSCITWLDSQPSGSVIFVSFGSLVSLSRSQILEIGQGLLNSCRPFLWVILPNPIVGQQEDDSTPGQILMELENMSKEKGLIVSWAPQEKVLAHPAIGGFLTHSGWNSTMESIYARVPMICWPTEADQLVNSRCVSELWRIGFDMKDTCDRSTVEKLVNDLMEDKRDEIMKSMDKITRQAEESVQEGGSSYCNLQRLITDIRSLIPT